MLSYSNPPRVKICGITSVDDARVAMEAGADAIGLVFYEPSPRYITVTQAVQIVRTVGPFVTTVGLFVNASADAIGQVLHQVPLQLLQFHGDETATFCKQFQLPYMKAIRMKPSIDVISTIQQYPSAQAILLDAYRKGVPGGTGETFDWERVPVADGESGENTLPPIVLAGGLTPENVQQAVNTTTPYGVDVSGGVEKEVDCGVASKDRQKVINFIKNAKTV